MKYILSADDEPLNQLITKELLSDFYEIVTVGDGVTCIEYIEQRVPDLLLLDVSMPRMSGLDVCRTIRDNDMIKNLPIIILSAAATQKNIEEGIEAGANSYWHKPFSPKKLIAEIELLIGC